MDREPQTGANVLDVEKIAADTATGEMSVATSLASNAPDTEKAEAAAPNAATDDVSVVAVPPVAASTVVVPVHGAPDPHDTGASRGGRAATDVSRHDVRRIAVPLVTVAALLVVWELVVDLGLVPNFLLPSPSQVVLAFVGDLGLLASHAGTTLAETALGLGIGVAVGFATAVLMDRFEVVDLALSPLVTVSQTVPTVAVAPLLVLWFGYGLLPKVLLIALTTFFPITVSLAGGLRAADPDTIDLMRTMNASEWQIFWQVKLPGADEQFFSGLRISATYAIVGAVIAEWLGGFAGLGVYMTRVRKSFSYDKMFAVIVLISALSLALMQVVKLLERVCMPWKRVERK